MGLATILLICAGAVVLVGGGMLFLALLTEKPDSYWKAEREKQDANPPEWR